MDMKKVITFVFLGVLSLNSSVFAYDPLFKAINRGDTDEIEKFLKKLSLFDESVLNLDIKSVNEKNNLGQTPLTYAIIKYRDTKNDNFITIMKLLIEYGADVNIDSPLYTAILADSEEIFQFLLDKKAIIDFPMEGGNTLLMQIARLGEIDPKWLYLILKNKANINAQNILGETALMRAVRYNEVNKVRILKFAGADETIMNNNLATALDIANQENNQLANDLNNAIMLNDTDEINYLRNELKINNEIIKILQMKFEKRESKKNE